MFLTVKHARDATRTRRRMRARRRRSGDALARGGGDTSGKGPRALVSAAGSPLADHPDQRPSPEHEHEAAEERGAALDVRAAAASAAAGLGEELDGALEAHRRRQARQEQQLHNIGILDKMELLMEKRQHRVMQMLMDMVTFFMRFQQTTYHYVQKIYKRKEIKCQHQQL